MSDQDNCACDGSACGLENCPRCGRSLVRDLLAEGEELRKQAEKDIAPMKYRALRIPVDSATPISLLTEEPADKLVQDFIRDELQAIGATRSVRRDLWTAMNVRGDITICSRDRMCVVAVIDTDGRKPGPLEVATAQVISAAPEMLDALRALRALKENGQTRQTAKMLGLESEHAAHGGTHIVSMVWDRAKSAMAKACGGFDVDGALSDRPKPCSLCGARPCSCSVTGDDWADLRGEVEALREALLAISTEPCGWKQGGDSAEQTCVERGEPDQDWCPGCIARAAIAKAEGK